MTPFFATAARQAALIEEIRGWEGTRFWPGCGGRGKKGVGADCVSFVAGVLRNLGAIAAVRWPKHYVTRGGGAAMRVVMFEVLGSIPNMRPVWRPGDAEPDWLPGDVIIRSAGDDFHHMAIHAGGNTCWQMLGRGLATANRCDRYAAKDLQATYRVYERAD